MRVLYVYCHPLPESFHAAVLTEGLAGLAAAGHEVDLLDLYAEGFDPVLTAEGRRAYHDTTCNRRGLESQIQRLAWAEALVVQFPTWNFGPPAMLKGYFDRVLMPGVAFDMSDPKSLRPLLNNIRKVVGIVTYGQPRYALWYMADPPRKLVTRYLRWHTRGAATQYHALYHLNVAPEGRRRRFIAHIGAALTRL